MWGGGWRWNKKKKISVCDFTTSYLEEKRSISCDGGAGGAGGEWHHVSH